MTTKNKLCFLNKKKLLTAKTLQKSHYKLRNMKKIISCLLFLISLCANAQTANCTNKEIKLTSENSMKNVYFFFRKTNIEKHKRVDKVIDENGKVLTECKMKSKNDHDQVLINKFQRIIIIDNQIHKVKFKFENEFGSLKVYNKCGELIESKKIKTKELYDKYNFNSFIL
jgi:hypothetical protein